ncbi:MAG: ComF family protein [Campylobacterales bacterium]
MRCLLCLRLSINSICKKCQERLLKPTIYTRNLECGQKVYSLYPYNEIEELILTKHSDMGHSVYKLLSLKLADVAYKVFGNLCTVVPLESKKIGTYSHTALLAKGFKKRGFKVALGALQDRSGYNYGGKTLEYRLKNQRDFELKKEVEDVLLVDDIITTGVTFSSAISTLKTQGIEIVGCMTLSDARNIS